MQDQLLDWIARYNQPQRSQRWRTLKPGRAPKEKPPAAEATLKQPAPLPRLRVRVSAATASVAVGLRREANR
jgi:hypothetical protein